MVLNPLGDINKSSKLQEEGDLNEILGKEIKREEDGGIFL
jgi:hypothetical protein